MDISEKNRKALEAKRKELQVKLAVSDFFANYMKEWMHLYRSWAQLPIHFQLVYLGIVEQEYKGQLIQIINNEGIISSQDALDLIWIDFEKDVLKNLQLNFPSKNLLSYNPDLKSIGNYYIEPSNILKYFEEKELTHTSVYLVYTPYTPVIMLPFHEFILNYGIFKVDDYYDDILIFPANYSWLLFCSSDDEWSFGFK
jgi:hypothetical protein